MTPLWLTKMMVLEKRAETDIINNNIAGIARAAPAAADAAAIVARVPFTMTEFAMMMLTIITVDY